MPLFLKCHVNKTQLPYSSLGVSLFPIMLEKCDFFVMFLTGFLHVSMCRIRLETGEADSVSSVVRERGDRKTTVSMCSGAVMWCRLSLVSFVNQDEESNKMRKTCESQIYPESEAGSDGCRLFSVADRALN